ncbi:MAG: hypothetical protein ACOZIN_04195 [Myxococcota bacterium]
MLLTLGATLLPAIAWAELPRDAPVRDVPTAPVVEPYPWHETRAKPIPPGARLVRETSALTVLGGVVAGIPYVISLAVGGLVTYVNLIALLAGAPMLWEFPLLMVPVVGPFWSYLASGARHQDKLVYLWDGSLQAVGVALVLLGREQSNETWVYPRGGGGFAPRATFSVTGPGVRMSW